MHTLHNVLAALLLLSNFNILYQIDEHTLYINGYCERMFHSEIPSWPPPHRIKCGFLECVTHHKVQHLGDGIVPDRSAATLLPIIQQHVRPGTVIHKMSGLHIEGSSN